MRNTEIEYTSSNRMPDVLPEMERLLPPLCEEQFLLLESDILANGCYAPIVVNEDMVIIDGHNRFRICKKHGLPFKMLVFSFEDLLEAKRWALGTQRGRRNLSLWELGKIALQLKPDLETKAKSNQGKRTDISVNSSKALKPVDTRKEMAQAVGIGEQTMGRIVKLEENAPQVLKTALDGKKVSINRACLIMKTVQQHPKEKQESVAAEMLEASQELDRKDEEVERRASIARILCKAYEKAVLLTPTSESVRCWTECTRMTLEEMESSVQESYKLAQTFQSIGDIIQNEILPSDWRSKKNRTDIR